MTIACWDAPRGHHGPCCMVCVIEETDRRAGAEVPNSLRTGIILDAAIGAITTVRACCFHANWLDELLDAAVAEVEQRAEE